MNVNIQIFDAFGPSVDAARLAYNATLPPVTVDANGMPLPPQQTLPNPAAAANNEAFIQLQVGELVKAWVAKYGLLGAPVVVDGVPQEVSKAQAYEELISQGLHDDEDPALSIIEQTIARVADPVMRMRMRNLFRNSSKFERQKPELILLWTTPAPDGLGRTLAQLDQTFISAAKR